MKCAFYPRTLFSRLVLLLLSGLLTAELITALVLTSDRTETIQKAVGIHSAQRMAGIVRVLEQLDPERRTEAARALDAPGMRISLSLPPIPATDPPRHTESALFMGALRFYLGESRGIRLDLANIEAIENFSSHEEFGSNMGMPRGMRDMMRRHMAESGLILSTEAAHLIQVELADGEWVSFGEQLPVEETAWPVRIIGALALVLLTVGLVAFQAVRWITRPLSYLAESAHALGKDLQRPPLKEEGPDEVLDTVQAFNAMQLQINEFVDERSRFLAAVSHDLKTPITRLRLRTSLLEDPELQKKFERDLTEMEELVQGTLAFVRDEAGREQTQPLDINDLLESIQIDAVEMGANISLSGHATGTYCCYPLGMRRLVSNLLDNAIKYAGSAQIEVEDSSQRIIIRIIDQGPGIPPHALDEITKPFVRLENSRNRKTGGTGLGLSIADNIARAHGGELHLKNGDTGGFIAEITLPRNKPC